MNAEINPNALDPSLLKYAVGWDTAIGLRAMFAFFGALALLLTIRAILKRDCSVIAGVLWLIAGLVSSVFSIVPQRLVEFVISTEYEIRIRFIMGGLSVLALLITFESTRRARLQERYSLLWVATAVAILFCAVFPQAVNLFRAVTGMHYETALAALAFTFLALVSFHFSICMSAMESDRDKIAQRIAILEARLNELKAQIGAPEKAGPKSETKA